MEKEVDQHMNKTFLDYFLPDLNQNLKIEQWQHFKYFMFEYVALVSVSIAFQRLRIMLTCSIVCANRETPCLALST